MTATSEAGPAYDALRNPFEQAPPRDVAIEKLTATRADQVRHADVEMGKVLEYADRLKRGSIPPPIWVCRDRGHLFVVAGFHRLAAYKRLRDTTVAKNERRKYAHVPAVIVDMPLKRARWIGAQDNMGHGVPLKGRDWRRAFRMFVEAGMLKNDDGTHLSLREIADAMRNVRSHNTIHNWLREDFPNICEQFYNTPARVHKRERVAQQQEIGPTMHSTVEAFNSLFKVADVLTDEERRMLAELVRAQAAALEAPRAAARTRHAKGRQRHAAR